MSRRAYAPPRPWSRDSSPITRHPQIAACVIVGILLATAAGCSDIGAQVSGSSSSAGKHRSAAAVAPRPSAGCHNTGATPPAAGSTTHSLEVRGLPRSYIEQLPSGYAGAKPSPLVVDFHGYAEGAQPQTTMSGFAPLADVNRFIVLTPQGEGSPAYWNTALHGPDVALFRALLDRSEADLCIDLARVYVTGISNGAFLTSVIACVDADRVAAVAPVAGIRAVTGCKPARRVPVLAFHGTADKFVKYFGGAAPNVPQPSAPNGSDPTRGQNGGRGGNNIIVPRPIYQSVPQATAEWAKRNGCAAKPEQRAVASDVTLISYRCPAGADVELYRVEGGGHAWPGSAMSAAIARLAGRTTFSINATDLMWRFFVGHPLDH